MRGAGFSLIMALAVSLGGSISRHAAAQTNPTPASTISIASAQLPTPPRVRAAGRFLARRGIVPHRPHPLPSRPSAAETTPLAAAASPMTTSNWTAAGPIAVNSLNFGLVTGRISAIALDPSDATGNTVYLGTTGGGVWKSQNAASATPSTVAFVPITDGLAALAGVQDAGLSVGAVTVQPGGTGVVLAGLGDPNDALDSYYGAGILRSTDSGKTWALIQQTMDLEDGIGNRDYSFAGEGVAAFAWSSTNVQLVVAAVSQAYEASLVNATAANFSYEGLYYSTDGGASWHLAYITDGAGEDIQGPTDPFDPPDGNAATSVVWNPIRKLFIAAVRYHGYYQSSDGITFTRMVVQPGTGLTTANCPTEQGSTGVAGCPIFRGSLAVNPNTGDTFAWTVDAFNQDQGLWQDACVLSGLGSGAFCTNASVTFAKQLNTSALETTSQGGSATILNGDYNLTLAAIPSQQDTLIFAGADDLFRCSLANSCVWRNTTNSTTCLSAQVGEYQHALAWDTGNPLVLYFGNDSGLWRSLDAVAETGSVCATTDASHFQNLNSSLGSLAEVDSLAQSQASASTMLAGLGANGVTGIANAPATPGDWNEILGGEGGPVAVDPSSTSNSWYASNAAGVSIFHCTPVSGSICNSAGFGTTPVIGESQVQNDGLGMSDPAAFIFDTIDNSQVLIGTCRLWRGPKSGAGWSAANAISPVLDGSGSTFDCVGNGLINTLAVGSVSTGGEIIYAGMAGSGDGGGAVAGHLFRGIFAANATLSGSWTDLAASPVTNTGLAFNPLGQQVSGLYVDPHDATANTLYVTVSGLQTLESTAQLYRTTNAGVSWTAIGSNLPDTPANAVLVDPQDPNTLYVGTDVGVYVTRAVSTCISTACWSLYGSGLPLAPVLTLAATPTGVPTQLLTAGTYGRGIWQTPLATTSTPATTATVSPTSLTFASIAVGSTSSAATLTVKNTGSPSLTVTSLAFTGADPSDFLETSTCTGVAVANGATCTVKVSFAPTATGSRSAQLAIAANITGGQLLVPLTGTAVAGGGIVLTPASIAFGSQQVGTTTSQSINVQNTTPASVSITSVATSAPFVRGPSSCGTVLLAGAACSVVVEFVPTASGPASGAFTIVDSLGTQTAALTGTGLAAPTDTLSTTSLTFPSTILGQNSQPMTVTITNSGGEPLTAIGTSVAGSPSGQFSAVSNCQGTLAPSSSCTVSVTFLPTTTGSLAATLTLSDALRAQTVALKGTAVKPPALSLSKTALSFGSLEEGIVSTAQSLTVTNTGGAPLAQPGFSFSGPGSTAFTTTATTCSAALAPAATCTVSIVFTPNAAGATTATFTVATSTLGVASVSATLTGTGLTPPSIGVSPATLNLGTVVVGDSSNLFTVQVTNTGQIAMNLPTFAIGGLSAGATLADFALSPPTDITACTGALNPGSSCNIQITFTPSVVGTESATLTVSSTNAIPAAATVALTGLGSSPISLGATPGSLSFPATPVGSTSAAQAFTLGNTGRQAATGLALALSGSYALVPALTTCTANLGIKASCTIGVAFTPTASGDQPGAVTVSVNNLGVSPLVVTLDGTGVAVGGITVAPTQITFGSVVLNTVSVAQTLTVTNSGKAFLAGVQLQSTANFTLSSNTCTSTLNPGASCTTAITYKPIATGMQAGSVTISTTSAGVAPAIVSLVGNGIPAGSLSSTPAVVTFGSVTVGQSSSAQTVMLTNAAASALPGLQFTVAGDYSLPSNSCGTQIAAGASCTFTVSFAPSQAGTRTGSVTVHSTAAGFVNLVVGLTGTGLPSAGLTVSPSQLTFGSVAVGSNSAAQQLTVTNSGPGTLTGVAFAAAPPFSVGSGSCGPLLAAAGSCSVPVVFTPTIGGSQSSSVIASATTLGVPPVAVSVSGTGVLPATMVFVTNPPTIPPSLTFPAITVGATSASQTITLTNLGGVALIGLSLAVSGDFVITSTSCAASLAANGSCVAAITFTPVLAGGRSGFITASSTTKGVASASAALTGTGLSSANLGIAPAQLNFGPILVGLVSPTQTVTVTNSGQSPVADLALSASIGFAINPATTTCTAALAGGASCTASVVFLPTAPGSATGAVTASSILAKVTATATLSGVGALPPGILTNPAALLQFGTTSVGLPATPLTVTITNQGTVTALTGLALSVDSAASAAGFGITPGTCTATLAAQASCTLQVSLIPKTTGALTGNLIINSSNGGSTHIALAGFGFNFTFSVIGNPSATVVQGQTAYYTLAVSPAGGNSGTFSFACGQLPANALCLFNPPQLTGLRATGNVQLGIGTGAPTTSALRIGRFLPANPSPPAFLLCGFAVLPAFFSFFRRSRRGCRHESIHHPLRRILLCLCAAALVAGIASCAGSGGGGSSGSTGQTHPGGGTPLGTYPVTVTATAGGLSHTAQLTLIVN